MNSPAMNDDVTCSSVRDSSRPPRVSETLEVMLVSSNAKIRALVIDWIEPRPSHLRIRGERHGQRTRAIKEHSSPPSLGGQPRPQACNTAQPLGTTRRMICRAERP
jgi:hypothetical protein